jgi:hypothetical protein
MRSWLLIACLLGTQVLAQQAYRWTDENGQVHYSDRPAPGAAQVNLRGAQGYSAATAPPQAAPQVTDEPADQEAPTRYTAFNVVQPAQQETLWNIGTTLNVQVEIEPALQSGHHLGAYLDGELIDVGARGTQFQLTDVFRGLHDLQAVILDANGADVLRSLPVSFMVQQTTILNPNNPNRN